MYAFPLVTSVDFSLLRGERTLRSFLLMFLLSMMMMMMVSAGSGCAGTGSVLIAGVPDDLSFDLVVLPATGVTSEVIGSLRLPTARAHYVVHPNGNLHVERGLSTRGDAYPLLVRQLTTDEMLRLWQEVQRIQFATSAGRRLQSVALAEDPTAGVSFVMWVRSGGTERVGAIDSARAGGLDVELVAMTRLIRELDRLSWNH